MGRGQGRQFLGKAWLLHRQVAQDIDKESLLVGIVTVEGLLRGNPRLRQDGVDARCQIALLKKQSVSGDAELLAGLLGASALPEFHWHSPHFRNVKYVTDIARRTVIVKGQRDACPWSRVLDDGWCSTIQLRGLPVNCRIRCRSFHNSVSENRHFNEREERYTAEKK